MMNTLKHILLATFALAFLTLSCVDPLEPMPKGLDDRLPDKALVFSPSILGSTVVTKADDDLNKGVDALGELAIETLDVYVYKITSGTGDNAVTEFFKRYHFITVIPEGQTEDALATNNVFVKTAAELTSGTDIILETDWRQAGYDQSGTQPYRIYSIANSRMSGADRWANLSEADLKAKTITSAETHSGSYDIVRPKDGVGPGGDYYNIHIKDKNFLMDGMIDNWKITVNESQQYFTLNTDKSFLLRRAAAKFIVNVSFDPVFLADLAEEGTVLAPHEESSNTFSATGAPRFKFSNFMPVTYEVTPTSTPSGSWRDGNLWNSNYNYDFPDHTYPNPNYDPENPDAAPQTLSGDLSNDPTKPNYTGKATYTLTTYSYSFAWDGTSEGAVNAPALVLRVNYKTDNYPAETFFYRVPLVDLTKISSINRNYLYVVDATISSKGAVIEDIRPTDVVLKYQVLPWSFNASTDITEVEGAELLYFTAETTYILRGEGTQSIQLDYFTPKSELMNGHYLYEPVISNVKTYYLVSADETTNIVQEGGGTYSNSNRTWVGTNNSITGSRVTVNINPDTENDGGGGKVTISSLVLANRAVKHIEFDASVTFTITDPNTGASTTTIVKHHYHILHFPLDNIQSIEGKWSSRWDGQPNTTTTWYRKKYKKQGSYYEWISVEQSAWLEGMIGASNDVRMSAQSPETAYNNYYATGTDRTTYVDSDEYGELNPPNNPPGNNNSVSYEWKWSESESKYSVIISSGNPNNKRSWTIPMPISNITYDYIYDYDYDYYSTWGGRVYYGRAYFRKYKNYYHKEEVEGTVYSYNPEGDGWGSSDDFEWDWEECTEAEYNASADKNRKIETSTGVPSTGDWVVYNGGGNHTYRDMYYNYDYGYYAKVAATNAIHNMTASGSDSGSGNVAGNNVHMYVIQISKAESDVVLGRPNQNTSFQSSDNVVSPAFMIASQLGAVRSSSFTNAPQRAATHCHTYMEVDANGRRFVGWRLPTKAEIAYIAKYQNNNQIQGQGVFTYVLTGNWYYTLDGGDARSNYPSTAPDYDASDNTRYVRCIRDLTPEEVAELNSTGKITSATY